MGKKIYIDISLWRIPVFWKNLCWYALKQWNTASFISFNRYYHSSNFIFRLISLEMLWKVSSSSEAFELQTHLGDAIKHYAKSYHAKIFTYQTWNSSIHEKLLLQELRMTDNNQWTSFFLRGFCFDAKDTLPAQGKKSPLLCSLIHHQLLRNGSLSLLPQNLLPYP